MKKIKKNGFTIVELMGVITILGIIFLIAVPAVTRFLGKSKDQYYKTTMDNIESAVNEYLIDYPDDIPNQKKGCTEIPLSLLVKLNYIDTIKNPETKETCTENSYIYVTNEGYKSQNNNAIQGANFKLSYDICLKCGLYKGKDTMGTCKKTEKSFSFIDYEGNAIQTLTLGKETKFPLIVKDNSTKKSISFSSIDYTNSDESVVSISYGTLTANKKGNAIIKASYNSYIIYLLVNVIDEPVKVNSMTAWTSTAMDVPVNKITASMTVYANIKPNNANQDITCSIVDGNNTVVKKYGQVTKKTTQASINATSQSRYMYACEYTRFTSDNSTTIIDPITNEKTTNTYLLIKPVSEVENGVALKIPIYTE